MSDLQGPHGLQLPGSSIHGIFQARVLEWGAIAFSLELMITQQKLSLNSVLGLI